MTRTDTLHITPEILGFIARIDEFKGAWRALGTLAPDRLAALRRVATIESIGSSTRIEGSKLSDREVERLLSNLEINSFDTRDEQEVAGYAEAMDQVFSFWQDIPFTENYIKQLHLLHHVVAGLCLDVVLEQFLQQLDRQILVGHLPNIFQKLIREQANIGFVQPAQAEHIRHAFSDHCVVQYLLERRIPLFLGTLFINPGELEHGRLHRRVEGDLLTQLLGLIQRAA